MRSSNRSWWSRPHWILFSVIVILVAIRVALPSIILRKLNNSLANLEGPLCGHIADVDLAIIRGAYELQDFTLMSRTKSGACREKLLSVERTKISAAWGELLKGKARLRVDLFAPQVAVDPLITALETSDKRAEAAVGAQKTWDILVPWRIDALGIREGKAYFVLFGQGGISTPLEQVEGEVTGIESSIASELPILYRIKGSIFGGSSLVAAGSMALGPGPTRWEVDFNAEQVDLTNANPFLYNRVPLTFTTGKLDLFGEAAGKGADVEGYVRTIFTKVDVVGNREKWKNFSQGLYEIVSALFFVISKNTRVHTVGTELVFHKKGTDTVVDWAGAVARALQHSGGKLVPRGVDNSLGLPKP
ncbi:MAG: DUF748 domain-containing protein [Bacteriovoracia bacterium]